MGKRRSKYGDLLEDADVRRWYRNVARGSRVTADVYLRRVGGFCAGRNMTPTELAAMDERDLRDLLMDFVSSMEEQGYSGSYIESIVKAVRSWLSHNYVEVKGKIKIKGARETPSLRDERVPTQEELKRILLSGDRKTRVACVLVAHSGLRLKTLGNYGGDDGLRVKDIPEMMVEEAVEFEQIPTKIVVRRKLSKAGHQYFTFLSEEGCEYLRDYLEDRMRQGEEIGPESPIITPKRRMKSFIRAINIGDVIRGAVRGAGFPWRPYVLRSYFDTQLMLAESKGLVLRDYRQFWMGHKGDIENRYTTNKQKLPEAVIEDMRKSYWRSQEYLQTTRPEASEKRLREVLRKQLLLVAGFSQEEVEETDLSAMGDEEFQAMVRKRLLGEKANNCSTQKVVAVDEVESHLAEGWEFVAALPNGKVILKQPL